ncbi:hypothetical protein G6F57_020257 [Rhizopus arrhizus]|nr:hypothetical protein G6F57_020257 [Rhizopus arrhizus]
MRGGFHLDDVLAGGAALLQCLQGDGHLFQWQAGGQPGTDQSMFAHAQQPRLRQRDLLGLAVAVVAPLQTDDADVLEQQIVRLQRRDLARREADHHQPAAPGQGAQRSREDFVAQGIEHDVCASAIGCRPDLIAQAVAQVFHRQIDHVVGPPLAGHLRL